MVVENSISRFSSSDSGESPTGSTLSLILNSLDFSFSFGPINGSWESSTSFVSGRFGCIFFEFGQIHSGEFFLFNNLLRK